MPRSRRASAPLIALALIALVLPLGAQSTGPDVIVGDLPNVSNYGTVGGIKAYSVGTTSCNIGTTPLSWVSNNNQHPVIGQNLYRYANGRFELLGISWLKHGFLALSGNVCDTCTGPGGSQLDPGCSDPYSSGLNGSQSGLGPRSEVNASTGTFNYPFTSPSTPATIGRRLQVKTADLQDPTAQYFVEGHYVTPDDAAAGHQNNNASYRPCTINGNLDLSLTGQTVRMLPAIHAWQVLDPMVHLDDIDIANDGRFVLGYKATDLGGGQLGLEFALHNLNSHRSGRGLTINFPGATTISNDGFHDVDYHSGDGASVGTNYDGTDWTFSSTASAATWVTQTMAQNSNANALRWGTLYNFRCQADAAPTSITLELWRPGTPTTVTVPLPNALPQFSISYPNGLPSNLQANTPTTVAILTSNLAGAPDPATATLHSSIDGAAFTTSSIASLGGGNFQATLPGVGCGSTVDWYVSIAPIGGGGDVLSPADAPSTTNGAGAGFAFQDDFETNTGWTVTNSAGLTDGAWDRGMPVGGGVRGDPPTDGDSSGQCYLTDNVSGNSDVDGGSTTLTSPAIDISSLIQPTVNVLLWHDNDFGGSPAEATDTLLVEMSSNGTNWVTVEAYDASVDAWVPRSYDVATYVSSSATFRIRFTSTDIGGGSVVESGIDGFAVTDLGCNVGPPVADFVGIPTSGVAPLTVSFTDLSTGSPTSWSWGFGDGSIASQQNPTHTFNNPGTYTIALSASSAAGTDAEVKFGYITVNAAPPIADFVGTPTSGTAPLLVTFANQTTGGSVTSWSWTFGDGTSSTQQSPSHTYAAAGTYTVSLTATGPGGSDGETKAGYITVNDPAPIADFVGTPTSGIAPLGVNFTDQTTGNVTSWSWSFGDGTTSTLANPSHVYGNPGLYDVALTAIGPGGSTVETKTGYVLVGDPPPAADFAGAPTGGEAPLAVGFTDLSAGNVASWSWSFGDGATSTSQNPMHLYPAPGVYTVSLTATGPGGSNTMTKVDYIAVSGVTGYYLTFDTATTLPGLGTVQPEDIVFYDRGSATWSLHFDGSDVGLGGQNLNAIHVFSDGSFLYSLAQDTTTVPGLINGPAGTAVTSNDLLYFLPVSLGVTSAGTHFFAFDGSDVGLDTPAEAIDALHVIDLFLIMSTRAATSGPGLPAAQGEDLLFFLPIAYGPGTQGSWLFAFDGSDVGLGGPGETLDAGHFDNMARFLFSTDGPYVAGAASGAPEDLSRFVGGYGFGTVGSIALIETLSNLGTTANVVGLTAVEN